MATLVATNLNVPYQVSTKIKALSDIVSSPHEDISHKEQAVIELGALLSKNKLASELGILIKKLHPFIEELSKIKAAKIIKSLIDSFLSSSANLDDQIGLCKDCIQWAQGNGHVYLRQSLESRLITIYYERKQYQNAIEIVGKLLSELKKIDDKELLVYVHLQESRIYYQLGNIVKSRSSLISARTTANGIYCPQQMQAKLEFQSGVIHSADEKDFKLAYSYFYEAFENFDKIENPLALVALKYMILCKIMLLAPDEVPRIMTDRITLKYGCTALDNMLKFGEAVKKRSLAYFNLLTVQCQQQLDEDPNIAMHLRDLRETLFEQNLLRIIEPFSAVQISHIASLISLPMGVVEVKLSQMVLDGMINGILDQNNNALIINDDSSTDEVYEVALTVLHSTENIISRLFTRAKKLA